MKSLLKAENLPQNLQKLVSTLEEKQSQQNEKYQEKEVQGDMAYPDEFQFKIVKDGKTIGYVIHILDSLCDRPYWEGSGTYYFIHAESLKVVTEVSWQG